MSVRYRYAGPFKSFERADDVLASMWAAGEVGPLEDPRIQTRGKRYFVTLRG